MLGFGASGSGEISLCACCARERLQDKNATSANKRENWQRRKLLFGRMKCGATQVYTVSFECLLVGAEVPRRELAPSSLPMSIQRLLGSNSVGITLRATSTTNGLNISFHGVRSLARSSANEWNLLSTHSVSDARYCSAGMKG
jgi:hypothetical protein